MGASHGKSLFVGLKHGGSGDMMFVVVEGQDFTCPRLDLPSRLSLKHLACYIHTHEIPGHKSAKWRAQRAHVPYMPYVPTRPTCPTCPRAQVYFTDRKIKNIGFNEIK